VWVSLYDPFCDQLAETTGHRDACEETRSGEVVLLSGHPAQQRPDIRCKHERAMNGGLDAALADAWNSFEDMLEFRLKAIEIRLEQLRIETLGHAVESEVATVLLINSEQDAPTFAPAVDTGIDIAEHGRLFFDGHHGLDRFRDQIVMAHIDHRQAGACQLRNFIGIESCGIDDDLRPDLAHGA